MLYTKSKKHYGKSFYFHDYETFGVNPKLSAASQFAGIRTDEDLNIIEGSELNIYCRPREDQLPSPMACIVTRITPQHIERQDPSVVFNEYDFSQKIFEQMRESNTCNIGYNNVGFDDEWSRNLFYRNYIDPYEREWKNGCSRADGLNIVMMAYLFNPSVLNFPPSKDENGDILLDVNGNPLPSFKLELLSAANGIVHENAHDALSDVIALIGILKIIKEKDPVLFDYCLSLNNKQTVSQYLTEYRNNKKPFLHVSSFYGKKNNSCSVVMHIGNDASNKNSVYLFDLSKDPAVLEKMSPTEIRENLFSKNVELEEVGVDRVGIKSMAINKLPMFFPLDMIKGRANDIGIAKNSDLYRENIEKLKGVMSRINVQDVLDQVFNVSYEPISDPDQAIYDGVFASNQDKSTMGFLHDAIRNGNLNGFTAKFDVKKFNNLYPRFIARNYPEMLSEQARHEWLSFCKTKLTNPDLSEYDFELYFSEINDLMSKFQEQHDSGDLKTSTYEKYVSILNELIDYGEEKKKLLNVE